MGFSFRKNSSCAWLGSVSQWNIPWDGPPETGQKRMFLCLRSRPGGKVVPNNAFFLGVQICSNQQVVNLIYDLLLGSCGLISFGRADFRWKGMKFIWSGWFWGFGAEILEKVNLNRRIFHHFPGAKMLHAICTFSSGQYLTWLPFWRVNANKTLFNPAPQAQSESFRDIPLTLTSSYLRCFGF